MKTLGMKRVAENLYRIDPPVTLEQTPFDPAQPPLCVVAQFLWCFRAVVRKVLVFSFGAVLTVAALGLSCSMSTAHMHSFFRRRTLFFVFITTNLRKPRRI
jgi:hypothetical protein